MPKSPLTAMLVEHFVPVRDYDLAATLNSGQVFRWRLRDGWWEGVIGRRWVSLAGTGEGITARIVGPVEDWGWLDHYLQSGIDLDAVLETFPNDAPLGAAVGTCRGLRILRQDLWECLASFILSSTKQIVQIQQIIDLLCTRFGDPVPTPAGRGPAFSFPSVTRLAEIPGEELRACKMGFRAPNLLATARLVATGEVNLDQLCRLPIGQARSSLLRCPGVGEKIANCVLLFACGFAEAFPVDVWVMKALRQLYFPCRRPKPARLRRFIETHFGPCAGWAQQYLFHYMRVKRPTLDQPDSVERLEGKVLELVSRGPTLSPVRTHSTASESFRQSLGTQRNVSPPADGRGNRSGHR